MVSDRRSKTAATKVFVRASEVNGLPRKIVSDNSGANTAGITAINGMLKRFGCLIAIGMVRIKYLTNIVVQDHAAASKTAPSMCTAT
jgi:putative transposase